jgi:Ras-related protein Rab-1A
MTAIRTPTPDAPLFGSLLDYDFLMKCVVIGDSGVGKSSLLRRFTHDDYFGSYISTIGVDFEVKSLTVDDHKLKIQLWDTAGQERFRTITTSYYRGSHAIMIVFDVTNRDSFRSVPNWLAELRSYTSDNVQVMIVANKTDMDSSRMVSVSEIEALCARLQVQYFETSAKSSYNVHAAFAELGRRYVRQEIERNPNVIPSSSDPYSADVYSKPFNSSPVDDDTTTCPSCSIM